MDITSAYKTDHALITMNIENDPLQRGPGLWKFHNRLLHEKQFMEKMQKVIETCKGNLSHSKLNPIEKW